MFQLKATVERHINHFYKLEWIEIDCICRVNLKKVGPPFFKFYQFRSKCHLHSWKIVLSYVAVILQMKDSNALPI